MIIMYLTNINMHNQSPKSNSPDLSFLSNIIYYMLIYTLILSKLYNYLFFIFFPFFSFFYFYNFFFLFFSFFFQISTKPPPNFHHRLNSKMPSPPFLGILLS